MFEETTPICFPLTFLTTSIGWLLFGLATLRAGVYPRVAAIVLMVGAAASFLPLPGSEAGPTPPDTTPTDAVTTEPVPVPTTQGQTPPTETVATQVTPVPHHLRTRL